MRVPLIISWPGRFQAGLVSDALVELTDLAPTLAELAGIPLEWTHGRSLVPLLTGEADPHEHREFVRCEYYNALGLDIMARRPNAGRSWATMYRDRRHKLVVYHGLDCGQLFDLEADPGEFDNLWDKPEAAALKAEIMKRSFDATVAIGDPGPPLVGRY